MTISDRPGGAGESPGDGARRPGDIDESRSPAAVAQEIRLTFESGEYSAAQAILEGLEGSYGSLDQWSHSFSVFSLLDLRSRAELLTRRFLSNHPNTSALPYVKLASLLNDARRLEEARSTLREMRAALPDVTRFAWEVTCQYFAAGAFDEALGIARDRLSAAPDEFPYWVMECRCLWHLGRRRQARQRLKALHERLGTDSSRWTWYCAVGNELRQGRLVKRVKTLLARSLASGAIRPTRSAVDLILQDGFVKEAKAAMGHVSPQECDQNELQYFFGVALGLAENEKAVEVGEYIMRTAPHWAVRDKLQTLARSRWSRFGNTGSS